jgi:creatinine amidohydrolase
MQFRDLNWMDVERYLQQDDRILLVIGSTEQHSYMSLAADVEIPMHLALAAAAREPVLIAPPLNFGISDMFVAFPGTITLSRDTFNMLLTEIVQGLLGQGFEGFLVLNGHSGNKIPPQLEDMRLDSHVRIRWHDWWRGSAARAFEQTHGLRIDHGNWSENFPFTRVAEVPAEEKPLVNLGYLETGELMRDVLKDGSFGGPYQVEESLTQALFDQVVSEIVEMLQALKR